MPNTTATAAYRVASTAIHQRARTTRSRSIALAAILWLAAAALAPQAFAASCTSTSISLAANQWRMVGIPCVPVSRSGGAAQVGNVFMGNNLVAANYFNGSNAATATWVLWKRNYTATGDSYTRMAVTDPVVAGGAYWLYTRTVTLGNTFQVNGTATPGTTYTTPSPALPVAPSGTNRYVMYTNPWASGSMVWSEDVEFNGNGGPWSYFIVTLFNYVDPVVSYWNGNTYTSLSGSAATFAPNVGVWLRLEPNASTVNNISFIATKP